jgi:polysaccharide export outer membrane protein
MKEGLADDARAAEAAIRPLPLTPIPDDPPPHEGAMIDIPYVIGAPDLLTIEVLYALPGRPISGERLVRPDGTISLGFYGDVHVRGLTLKQAKVKIIHHLRQFLGDELLLGNAPPEEIAQVHAPAKVSRLSQPAASTRVFVDLAPTTARSIMLKGECVGRESFHGPGRRLCWTRSTMRRI